MKSSIKTILALLLFPLWVQAQRYVGGDISLLPTYEAHGVHYLDRSGTQVEPLPYFRLGAGWNAMRVRLFVDPSKASVADQQEGVRQDLNYVTSLCQRIKDEGYALMLDFHYSDTWTDPGQHSTPSRWASNDPVVLADSVYQYTRNCLEHLKNKGVTPDFIQPGNEVTFGMMWPTGHCYPDGSSYASSGSVTGTSDNFVSYLQAGVKACREVCPTSKIVMHTELSTAWNATTFYNTLANRVDYDIIGLSYYPDYHGPLSTLTDVLTTLESKHGEKNVMIVETGYGSQWSLKGNYSTKVQATWPLTETGQQQFTLDLIATLADYPKVIGLFWWMPEDNEFWTYQNPARSSWWDASLYTQTTGRPLSAMFELQRFIGSDPTSIQSITIPTAKAGNRSTESNLPKWYNLRGQRISSSSLPAKSIYIKDGKKVVVQ